MYSIGQILYKTSSMTDRTTFYIISGQFVNFLGENVYEIETLGRDETGFLKFKEIEKHVGSYLTNADGLTLF